MKPKRLRFLAPLFAASLVATAAACDSGEETPDASGDGECTRAETLFTSGAEWGTYANYNPYDSAGSATGVEGLMYETLFHYDPIAGEFLPWLAESGEWTADDEYTLTLRDGIEWTDGEPFTSEDVKFSLDLREIPEIPFSPMNEWVGEVTAPDERTVVVTFTDPRRGEWNEFLRTREIVAEHTWADKRDTIMEAPGDDIKVGTGPYLYAEHNDTQISWERNEDWWGIEALGLEMAPRCYVDFSNTSNEAAVPALLSGQVDLSTNFLPADTINNNEQIVGYYNDPAGALPWNTAFLIMNHDRAPFDDVEFRRALAYSIDVDSIIEQGMGNLVEPANPTSLLQSWVDLGFVNEELVAEHGWSYDPAEAESILDDAGYELDGDFRTTPDGEPIELTIAVPSGWTDWEIAAEIIAEGARAVGINVTADFPEAGDVDAMRVSGDYDLVVNNQPNQTSNPYTNYHYLYQLPVQEQQPANNFGRYVNEEAWDLSQDLAHFEADASSPEYMEILSQLQEITMRELPAIPMWYNGLWFQANTTYWTNWPSADPDTPTLFGSNWNGVWEMGGVQMLAELEPAG